MLAFGNGTDHGESIGPELIEGVRAPSADAPRQHRRDAPDQIGARGTAHRTRPRLSSRRVIRSAIYASPLLKIGAR